MNKINISIPVVLSLNEAETLYEKLGSEIRELKNKLSEDIVREISLEFSDEYLKELTDKVKKFYIKLNKSDYPPSVNCSQFGVGFNHGNHYVSFFFFDGRFCVKIERRGNNYLPNGKELSYSKSQLDMLENCLIHGLNITYVVSFFGNYRAGLHVSDVPPNALKQAWTNSKSNNNSIQGNQDFQNWLSDWEDEIDL